MSKTKNRIDVEYALCVLTDAGYEPQAFNSYQIRVFSKNRIMFDWYHTTGSLVRTRNSIGKNIGTVFEVERVLNVIKANDNTL